MQNHMHELAHSLAAAFAGSELDAAAAAAFSALLPSACFCSLCVSGSPSWVVMTSSLLSGGFVSQCLVGRESLPCFASGLPEILSRSRVASIVPANVLQLNSEWLCIPIAPQRASSCAAAEKLFAPDTACLGCLLVGLRPSLTAADDEGVAGKLAKLIQALAAELPKVAVRPAEEIVSRFLPARPSLQEAAPVSAAVVIPARTAQELLAAVEAAQRAQAVQLDSAASGDPSSDDGYSQDISSDSDRFS